MSYFMAQRSASFKTQVLHNFSNNLHYSHIMQTVLSPFVPPNVLVKPLLQKFL